MVLVVGEVRPIDGHAQQGAAEALNNGTFEDCPWPDATLAKLEWQMGFLGMTLQIRGSEDVDVRRALGGLLQERVSKFSKMTSLLPSVHDCEIASELPVTLWHGNDEKVARAIHEHGLLQNVESGFGLLRVVKGAYWGPVSNNSPQGGASPTKAIWLESVSGIVVDPFRWIVEDTSPRLWAGNTDQHDAGGMRLRAILSRQHEQASSHLQPSRP